MTTLNTAPSFLTNGTGKVIQAVGTSDGYARSVIQQADGKLVVAGGSHNGSNGYDFSLIRLNTDGTLDTTFGNNGKLIQPVSTGDDLAYSVIQQADGKLVVAGHSWNGNDHDFSVIRLNTDGTLDTTFGIDGKILQPVGTSGDYAYSLIQQADGKLVVAGHSWNGNNDFSLIRLNTDGSLDTSFGDNGKLIQPDGSNSDYASSIIQQTDGKLVVAGHSFTGIDLDFSLIRLNPNGSLDTSFGDNGKLIQPDGSNHDYASSIIQQADGKLVVAGRSWNGSNSDFSLIRLNTNGTLDTTFGIDGKILQPVGTYYDWAYSVIQQADGKLIVAGTSDDDGNYDFSLIRLNADGTLDTTFGDNGKLIQPVGTGTTDIAYSIIQQADGKLVVAGTSGSDFSLIRLNADGTLDTTFNATSSLDALSTYTKGQAAVVLDNSVGIVDAELAALNNGQGDYAGASLTVARQGGAYAEDQLSINTTGTSFTVNGAELQKNGSTFANFTSQNGSLSINFTGTAVATQALVNEVLSNITYANTSDNPPASVNLAWTFSDGNTSTQGTGGALTTTGNLTVNITAVNDAPVILGVPTETQAVQPGIAAQLADFTVADPDSTNLSVTLTTTNGTLNNLTDADTNAPGIQLTGTAAQINAAIANATFTATTPGAASIGISVSDSTANPVSTTYNLNATSSSTAMNTAPSFSTNGTGKLIQAVGADYDQAMSVIQQADGKIVVAGFSGVGDYNFWDSTDFSLIRLNADGSLDTTFGDNGKLIQPVGTSMDVAESVIQQADGKLVVAGISNGDFSLIRLNPNGSLDTSFGDNGKLIQPVSAYYDSGRSVIQQADGKLVVAGFSNGDFGLIRLNTDGTLDISFGNDGKLIQPVGTGNDLAYSVIQQADGKLVVAGMSWNGSNEDFSLIRLNTDGTLDTTFGINGKLIQPVGTGNDLAYSVIQQADGKLLVTGESDDNFSLIRLNPNGTLDTGFGDNGKIIQPGSNWQGADNLILQSDGKLAFAVRDVSTLDIVITRLNPNGSIDTTFGDNGRLSQPDFGYISGLIQQADGKLVAAGSNWNWSDNPVSLDFSLIRLNTDGTLDTTFTAINSLNALSTYIEGEAAVVLDNSVAIVDAELAALNNGQGDYAGASLTVARQGAANTEDQLSINTSGTSFTVNGAELQKNGSTFANFTSQNGSLSINFTGSAVATQALVNEVLSNITYANTSDNPPASINLAWAFSDGNTGTQGTGGALTTTGNLTVNITAVNDAPVILGVPTQAQAVETGIAAQLVDFTVADPDSTNLSVTLTTTNGTLNNLTDADTNAPGIQLTGTAAQINAAIANATFTATTPGAASIGISVSDSTANPVSTTYNLNATSSSTAMNNAPVVQAPLATISLLANRAFSMTIPANTFIDPDGDSLTYSVTLANGDPLPAWMTFNPATGNLFGNPPVSSSGTLALKLNASDPHGAQTSTNLNILVSPLTQPGTLSIVGDTDLITNSAWSKFNVALGANHNYAAGDAIELLSGSTVIGKATLTAANLTSGSVDINLSAALKAGDNAIAARAVTSTNYAGQASAPSTVVLDTTGPTLKLGAEDGATGVDRTANITVKFSEAIALANTGTIRIVDAQNRDVRTIDLANATQRAQLSVSNDQLVINPTDDLKGFTDYRVEFGYGAIRDLAGNPFAGAYTNQQTLNFTTDGVPLTQPGSLSIVGDTDLITNNARAQFNVTLGANHNYAVGDAIELLSGSTVIGKATLTAANLTSGSVNITLSTALKAGDNAITARAVTSTNYAGQASAPSTVVLDTTAPTLKLGAEDGATGVDRAANITVKFSEAIALANTGTIRIVDAQNRDVRTIDLANAAQRAQLSVSNDQLVINPTDDLKGFTEYRVEFGYGAIRDLAGNPFAGAYTNQQTLNFTTDGVPLTQPGTLSIVGDTDLITNNARAQFNVTLGANHNYAVGDAIELLSGSTVIGKATLTAANLTSGSVNITLSTALKAGDNAIAARAVTSTNYAGQASAPSTVVLDTTGPTLKLGAEDGATGVDRTANITVKFSEAIALANTGTIRIVDAQNRDVRTIDLANAAQRAQLSVSNDQLVINPTDDLKGFTEYRVEFGYGAIRDLAGNPFAGAYGNANTLNFTTDGVPLTQPGTLSIVGDTDLITNNARAQFNVTLGANHNYAVGDAIELLSGSTVIGKATLTAANLTSGSVNITLSTALKAGDNAIAARAVTSTNYAGQASAPSTVVLDTTGPTLKLGAEDGATGVDRAANITVKFSEAIALANTGTIRIVDAQNRDVRTIDLANATQRAQLSVSNDQLVVDPVLDLLSGTEYRIDLGFGIVRDLAGNNFSGAYGNAATLNFTTATAPSTPQVPLDTTAPTLVSATPSNHSGGMLTLQFSETIRLGENGVIKFIPETTNIPEISISTSNHGGQISVNGNQIVIDPVSAMHPGEYSLSIENFAVLDIAGNAYDPLLLDQSFTIQPIEAR